mmetsp:Transcript_96908/g.250702  ORF Transcript_96908/g.250702 Transcript_96908/m.250702 type:complete len:211 (+) Transcript_96908:339-971(+)
MSSSEQSDSSSLLACAFFFSFFSFSLFLSFFSDRSFSPRLAFSSLTSWSHPERRLAPRRASAGWASLVGLVSGRTAAARFPWDPDAVATPAAARATRSRSRPLPTSSSHAASSSALAAGASLCTSSTTMPAAARRFRSMRTSSSDSLAILRASSRSTSICFRSRSASWSADTWAFCASRKAALDTRSSSSAEVLSRLASSASPRSEPSCD